MLSRVLAPQVSNGSRSRGYSYFRSGAVAELAVDNGILVATVEGSERYAVRVEPDGREWRCTCTCPYFTDRLDICKHVWAVLLAAEARGLTLLPPGQRLENVELVPFDPYGVILDDEYLDEPDRPWSPKVVPLHPLAEAPKALPPPWQTLLHTISTPPTAAPPGQPPPLPGELIYVLDIQAALDGNAVVLDLMSRMAKVSGGWSKPKQVRLAAGDIRARAPAGDVGILERLAGATLQSPTWASGYGDFRELSRLRLYGSQTVALLPEICRTGRCFARPAPAAPSVPPDVAALRSAAANYAARYRPPPPSGASLDLLPVAWDDAPPWRFHVIVRRDEAASVYAIEGFLARDGNRMAIADPLLVLDCGVLLTRSHVAWLDHGGAFAWLAALRKEPRITIPFDARVALLDALISRPLVHADLPADLQVEIIEGHPSPRLRLSPAKHRHGYLEAEVTFDYQGLHVAADHPHAVLRSADASRAIRRDRAAEQMLLAALTRAGARMEWSASAGTPTLQAAAHLLPRMVRTLLAEQWHVEAAGVAYRRPSEISIHVSSGIDWFELHAHVDYGGESASLPALLAAAKRGDPFVTLGDGSAGLLPEEWLNKHGLLTKLGTADGDWIRFRPSQVALLDALLAAQPAASWDETFGHARRELAAFDGIAPADPPPSFTGTLRGYQREGLGWLLFLQRFGFGGCLADDMGLGKTVMVLALLTREAEAGGTRHEPRPPSLVVAPRSLVFNWQQEAARFAPGLRVLVYTGGGRDAQRERFAEHDLVLTTYGTLRRDAAHLAAVDFHYVVLDEAQSVKNASSASAKATRLLRARHRLALSGTPVENHLGELWSLFEFLNPGFLGAAAAFERAGAGRRLDEATVATLARGLKPFILRRTKAQVAPELPPKTEQTLYCELEKPQRSLYDELRSHYRRTLLARVNGAGLGRAKLQVLEALLRLRQAACHPGLIDAARTKDGSAKLDVLLPHIAQAVEEGHKTLVFSQFTSFLAILRARLDAEGRGYEYLDGQTQDRQSKVERFQTDPDCKLFLISLKAGGLGLNLTAAEYVFLLDPWWNPAVEAQAIDRAHRIGQSRHVFAYRLIARDTVEERVLELQQHKRKLADAILSADGGLIKDLRREDLELLLS
jgi:superfamily II DNA or RNA helicase